MPENPDAEKAALVEALVGFRQPSGHFVFCDTARGLGLGRCTPACEKACAVLSDISPAAKEILEKAQAHDAMKAENERLRAAEVKMADCLERVGVAWSYSKGPKELWRKFKDGLADEIDETWAASPTGEAKLSPIRAALAGKEPE